MNYDAMILEAHDKLFAALPPEMSEADKALIEKAYLLAEEAHRPQKRKSGLPYILHPLAVALVVVEEMRQKDAAIVCAALLHDVVEDTDHTIEEINELFGEDVAFLVGAVTKPNKKQVDNFQHILQSVNNDIRVLILKLSDRLHNMRTLDSMRPQKQWKIASETQFFFAPLAGRLGLFKVKSELENLAFKFLNPSEYEFLSNALAEDRDRTRAAVDAFIADARKHIAAVSGPSVSWDIRYRNPYSIWREMREHGCDFYHVPDKHYIRVLYKTEDIEEYLKRGRVDEQDIALKIYSTLSRYYREQTGSFVNYINQPKSNGYQSIHVRLLNPFGGVEEFHISSVRMREQSVWGCLVEGRNQWLPRLTDVLKELSEDPESMMPGIRESLYNEDIVAFTPHGKAISLPKGATALDFAYGVHTDIGDHAQVARINGFLTSIKTVLKRGDCVEIDTNPSTWPQPDWMDAVVSYKAKKHIRNVLKHYPTPKYSLCPHCHPMPGNEIIGFQDAEGHITVHARNCPEAIGIASAQGNTIVAVEDFAADPAILYPVKLRITGIDRYHLLRDIIDCIVEERHLSMSGLATHTKDEIVTCKIDFAVHSASELRDTISGIAAIPGVEEVRRES